MGTVKHGAAMGVDSKNFPGAYKSWRAMRARCTYPKHKNFHQYGGRGITICERWQSFDSFLADMGDRPKGKSLDRYPDPDGDYSPENCRWATQKQQVAHLPQNKRGYVWKKKRLEAMI